MAALRLSAAEELLAAEVVVAERAAVSPVTAVAEVLGPSQEVPASAVTVPVRTPESAHLASAAAGSAPLVPAAPVLSALGSRVNQSLVAEKSVFVALVGQAEQLPVGSG